MDTTARRVIVAMALEHGARGARIARLREAKDLSQEAMARRLEMTTSGYQKWELGGGIRRGNLSRLAEILDTTIDEIEGRDALELNQFSLAAELAARTEEFRQFAQEMTTALDNVSDRLARQYEILAAIFEALTTPGAMQALNRGAQGLAALGQAEATARSESAERDVAERRRRQAG
jgi:transcriptional regulator with XRE-family HTH domain